MKKRVRTYFGPTINILRLCFGSEFHATKYLAHGVSQLVSAANTAMRSMNRSCALLPIFDPELRCKLFDSSVLPILSYANEVWGVDEGIGEVAELLLTMLCIGYFCSTCLPLGTGLHAIVLAELSSFLLRFYWSRQLFRQ